MTFDYFWELKKYQSLLFRAFYNSDHLERLLGREFPKKRRPASALLSLLVNIPCFSRTFSYFINVKNVHLVSGDGIRTHDLLNMNLLT